MIRRLKQDVLTELPEKKRQEVKILIEEKHNKLLRKISKDLSKAKKALRTADSKESLNEARSDQRNFILGLYEQTGLLLISYSL
jgi:SWI/SNF-related matrix-associated actin-dependent regulator 1 of chromatin subfamily A